MNDLKSYPAWDAGVRWFHWINVVCVIGLAAVALAILNAKALGVSTDGKILLKTVHVLIGYVFALNLLWRLLWAFIGKPRARWRAILPGGPGYLDRLRAYRASLRTGQPAQYIGHNPAGRLAVTLLLALLLVQAVTGLVLAGTDIFYPPFGAWIAGWIAAPGVDPATLVPYAREMYDPAAYDAMRAFRGPIVEIHELNFFVLGFFVLVHIVAVVYTELRGGGSLVSAMISGRKVLRGKPEDAGE
jgi:cytochrome b